MFYQPFHELFPAIAEKETRTLTVFNNHPELPADEYALIEAYCNEPGCDCRRVFFNIGSRRRQKIEAVIAYGKVDMIDDYTQAMELVEKMKAHLPITARPTKAFIHAMRQKGVKVKPGQALQIDDVLYMGDEGGIGCAVLLPGKQKSVTVASLTHLRVKAGHALADEIRVYQIERTQKLAQTNPHRHPTSFMVKPRRKRKKR